MNKIANRIEHCYLINQLTIFDNILLFLLKFCSQKTSCETLIEGELAVRVEYFLTQWIQVLGLMNI